MKPSICWESQWSQKHFLLSTPIHHNLPKICLPYLWKFSSGKMQVSKCRWSSYPYITQTPSNKSMRFGCFPAPANQETWISLQTLSWMEPHGAHTALILTRAPILCTSTHPWDRAASISHTACLLTANKWIRVQFTLIKGLHWSASQSWFLPNTTQSLFTHWPKLILAFVWAQKHSLLFSVLTGMGTSTALSHQAQTHPLWHGPQGKGPCKGDWEHSKHTWYLGRKEPAVWGCSPHTHCPSQQSPQLILRELLALPTVPASTQAPTLTAPRGNSQKTKLSQPYPICFHAKIRESSPAIRVRGKDVNLWAPFTRSANQNTPEVI